jgi:hypothetical protein
MVLLAGETGTGAARLHNDFPRRALPSNTASQR